MEDQLEYDCTDNEIFPDDKQILMIMFWGNWNDFELVFTV